MWSGRSRGGHEEHHDEVAYERGGVGDECDAFLEGSYVQYLRDHDMPIPVTAWLNRVAHAHPTALATLAASDGCRAGDRVVTWQAFQREVARLVLATAPTPTVDAVRAVQEERLVPLELRLMAGELTAPSTPTRFLQLVQAVVHRHPSAG